MIGMIVVSMARPATGISRKVFLIVLGDFSILAYRYIPWPWSALGWLIWHPGAVAFAAAPTYQLEAIAKADGRWRE
jgi:hypothetical protein